MKYKRILTVLVIIIAALSIIATTTGIFLDGGSGNFEFETLRGETVMIYGKGLYQYETAKLGPMTRGQDAVTLILCIPLMLIALYFSRKGSLKGRLLLTGCIGYFLYTYTQYTQIAYNQLFLVYVALMAISLYAFILAMVSFDFKTLTTHFSPRLPVKLIAGYEIVSALCLTVLWLKDIIPSLINGTVLMELDHYTTNPVYSMDLGLVVPTFLVAAFFTVKRKSLGYLLSSIMIIKAITMWTALTAMSIAAIIEGAKLTAADIAIAPLFGVITLFFLAILFKNINEKEIKKWDSSSIS